MTEAWLYTRREFAAFSNEAASGSAATRVTRPRPTVGRLGVPPPWPRPRPGAGRFGDEVVFGEMGVIALSRVGERPPVSRK